MLLIIRVTLTAGLNILNLLKKMANLATKAGVEGNKYILEPR